MQGGIDLLHAHIHFQSVFDACFQVLRGESLEGLFNNFLKPFYGCNVRIF